MTGSRYQVYLAALPEVCAADPALMAFTADADGRCEVFAWDAGAGRARQVTDRPRGTAHGTIDRDANVWWFDEDAHGAGHWRFQPFRGGPDLPGLTGVPPGTPRGLAVSDDGIVAIGLGDGRATSVHLGRRGAPAREVTRVDRHATLSGITAGAGLLAIGGPAGSAHAVTVLATDGTPRAVLSGSGEHGRLWSLGFAPTAERDELLLVRETDDRYLLSSWRPETGIRTYPWCAFDSEITARWYPDEDERRTVLIREDRHGRSTLHRARLDTGTLTRVPTPPGSLLDAAPRAGGDLHYLWTDTAHPPRMHSTAGTALPALGTVPGRVPGDHRDLWTPTPDGPVHTWLSLPEGHGPPEGSALPRKPELPQDEVSESRSSEERSNQERSSEGRSNGERSNRERSSQERSSQKPTAGKPTAGEPAAEGRSAPPPVVLLVHGGPADHDRDAYDGVVHSLVASGFAVARVNYRGSTGYGPRWRRAFGAGVGLTQVEDLVAVRADLIARGLAHPDAVGLWGTSWGGYLTLLALGTRPGLWQAGVAVKPVADGVAAYRTTTSALRTLDERLYGGTPDEVPEAYARSSPIRYAARVRAPLLVVAATRDAKCPPGQVRGYLAALVAAGARHESMWLDSGHDGYEGGDHVAVLRRAVVFLDRELRGTRGTHRVPKTPPADRRGDSGRIRTAAVAGTGTAEHTERRTAHAEGHHPQRPA
ncbi:alpha/beta hydrolase family protein [Streptomyces corynorhini]|uniref:alpha/beta hydrolase family protein n=1 Tax=Streptomyces corynorhini TaxID=2282652 RepID=UPI001F3B92F1|nr:prolyl oligopeptidase family serine peptidase [Streptomyces corynorhini]